MGLVGVMGVGVLAGGTLEVGSSTRSLSRARKRHLSRCSAQSLQMLSPMSRPDSIVSAPSRRSQAPNKTRTQCLPRQDGTMRQDCRPQRSIPGADLSVTRPHRSDVAGRLGASKSVEPRCTRADVVGAVALLEAGPEAARLGTFIQVGVKAPSAGLTM